MNSNIDEEMNSYQETNEKLKEDENGKKNFSVNKNNIINPSAFDSSATSENIKKDPKSKIYSKSCTEAKEKYCEYQKFNFYKNLEIFNDSTTGKSPLVKTADNSQFNHNHVINHAEQAQQTSSSICYKNIQNYMNFSAQSLNSNQFDQKSFGYSTYVKTNTNSILDTLSSNPSLNYLNVNNLHLRIQSKNIVLILIDQMFSSCLDHQLKMFQNVLHNYNLENSNLFFKENLMQSLYLLQSITNMDTANSYNKCLSFMNQSQDFNQNINHKSNYEMMLMDIIRIMNIPSYN